jgi:N-methylhydantoinase B
MTMDTIALQVAWNRLLSLCDEQQAALTRTAFSTVLREAEDLACGVFDTRGNMIAQSLTGTPGHINSMATGVRHFLRRFPEESLAEGDVLITNDPWLTASQVNDLTVLTPVFAGGRTVGYFANTCHAPDIGGRMLSAEAREVYEEGLRIPICKLFHRGEPNETLFDLIRANVRTPDETVGDIHAQVACNDVGARALLRLLTELGLDSIDPVAAEIIARSETAMRRAIAALPDGEYRNAGSCDGFEAPIRLEVCVHVAGDGLVVDFAGSSPQVSRGINVTLNYTHAYASFAIKSALDPEVPHNEGAFRPVTVTAPEGSILNCAEPAAVASRHAVGHFIPSLIYGALAPVLPERLPAASADALWILVYRGTGLDGRPYAQTVFLTGGSGARAAKDGLTTTGFPSGVGSMPVEVIESLAPLVVHRKEIRCDSGGPGRQRGGLGQVLELSSRSDRPWSLSAMLDRTRFPAPGVEGGLPGATGVLSVDGEPQASKGVIELGPASRVVIALPGGGGFGPPCERPRELVAGDVAAGFVSEEQAAAVYAPATREAPSRRR